MPKFVVEASWDVIRAATTEVQAKGPLQALRKGQENEDDWICDNHECADSDGPVRYTVWDETKSRILAEEPSEQKALADNGPGLLRAAKVLLTCLDGKLPITIEQIEALRTEIRLCEDTSPVLVLQAAEKPDAAA